MATSQDYAEWIVANQDKKGTPEFETVANAYKMSKGDTKTVKPYDVSSPVASMMNIGNSMAFGFGDELAPYMKSELVSLASGNGFSTPPNPKEEKPRVRETINQFKNDYPAAATIGSVSGAMALPFGLPKAFASAHPLITAATIGGTGGVLQAMGDAPTFEQGLQQAPFAGMVGMGLGPAFGMLGSTGGNVLSALGAKMKHSWAEDVARRRVATAFERDATNATDVGQKMVQLGPEARFVDSAGENTRGALDLNATLPGRTKELLEATIRNRQSTAFDRLNDSVVYTLSGGYGRAKDLTKALTEQQQKVAGPLYQKAHSQHVTADKDIIEILNAARSLGAFGEAKTIATAERYPFSLEKMTDGKVTTVTNPLTMQKERVTGDASQLSIKDIDYVKRGLDAMIERETNEFGKVSSKGRAFIGLKNELLANVDRLSPDFAAARQAFAGPAELKSAVEKGKRFWREEPTRLEDEIAGMTQSEQEAFRVGAAEALRTKVGSERGRTELMKMWKDNNIKERMRALLGDEVKYSDVANMVNNESVLSRMYQLGRGSQTASRQFANMDQNAGVLEDAGNLALNAKTGFGGTLLKALGKAGSGEVLTPEPVRNAMGRILLQQYQPAEMQALMKAQEEIRKLRALTGGVGGVSGAKASGSIPGLLGE